MKVGIVKASLLSKHNRMDADFYLGSLCGSREEDVRKAELNLRRAVARLKNVRREKLHHDVRVKKLIDDGDVVIIK